MKTTMPCLYGEKSDDFILPVRFVIMEYLCNCSSRETTFNPTLVRQLTEHGTVVAEKTWNEILPRESSKRP